jgi:hypothetical protein
MAGLDPGIQQHIENTHFPASWMAGSKGGHGEAHGSPGGSRLKYAKHAVPAQVFRYGISSTAGFRLMESKAQKRALTLCLAVRLIGKLLHAFPDAL